MRFGQRARSGLEQEIRDHIDRETENNIAIGMPPEEARRRAQVAFGNISRTLEDTRAVWVPVRLEQLRQDVWYAARALFRNRGFAAAVIITLGLGIGVNTAMFSLLDAVVIRKLDVPAAGELIALYENAPRAVPDSVAGMGRYLRFSYPRFIRLQQALGPHGSLAAMTPTNLFAARLPDGQNESIGVQLVSGTYFETFRALPARGRLLTAADTGSRSAAVAVVSEAFARGHMGGVENAIGHVLQINGFDVAVVGVARPGFTGAWLDDNPDVWLPLTMQPAIQYKSNTSSYGPVDPGRSFLGQDRIAWLTLVGRVSPSSRQIAETLLQDANRQGLAEFAVEATTDPNGRAAFLAQTLAIEPLAHGFSRLRARQSGMLLALMSLVAIILILTCANVANLLLVRSGRRAREIAVRAALGATTSRIVRHVLTEALLLSVLGGLAGVLAAGWSRHVLAREIVGTSSLLPAGFSVDVRMLLFALIVSLTTAIVFGLIPALRAAHAGNIAGAGLNERHTIGLGAIKGMRPLVVLQLALSVVVVFGATLLGRSLMNLVRVNPGFAVEHLVSASLLNVRSLAASEDGVAVVANRLVSAVDTVPGAQAAAVSVCGLLAGCSYSTSVRIEGIEGTVGVYQNWVGPKYFATVGLPLLRGRDFEARDDERSLPVAIITDSIARRYFPRRDPIGSRLSGLAVGQQYAAEIVGVVGDLRPLSLRDSPVAMVFYPLSRRRADAVPRSLDIRMASDPEQAVRLVSEALKRTEPGLSFNVTSMPMRLSQHMARERSVAYLTSAFAGLALALASVGLYGVLAYVVAHRNREIGVRMALGAQRSEVVALVLKQSAVLASIGLTLGLIAAPLAARSLQNMFFEVRAFDAPTFLTVAGIMLFVTILAAIIPARRATKVDPIVALRCE